MSTFYLVISAWDQENLSLGFQLAQSLSKEEVNINDLHFHEINLVYSGWSSNSFNLLMIGENKSKAETFANEVSEKFDNILREHYGESDLDKIDFDDHSLEQEFEELISYLRETSSNLDKIDDNNIIYKVTL